MLRLAAGLPFRQGEIIRDLEVASGGEKAFAALGAEGKRLICVGLPHVAEYDPESYYKGRSHAYFSTHAAVRPCVVQLSPTGITTCCTRTR